MLITKINSDIEERQHVMLKIKSFPLRYKLNENDEQLYLTHSIPTIYAIWEGFIQTSFQTYIGELNKLNLTIDTIHKDILVYHMDNNFKQFREFPEKSERKSNFFYQLKNFYRAERFEITRTVNTQSNVGFSVLNKILGAFNLELMPLYPEPQFSLTDELEGFLLKIRNATAHGTNAIVIKRSDVERAIKLVEMLMELVSKRIFHGFQNASYLA